MTNNAAETMNNRLRVRMRTAHPGFYEFCQTLSKEVENSKGKMEQFEAGNLQSSQSIRARTLQKSRTKLKEMLENQQITLRKYLRSQGVLNH